MWVRLHLIVTSISCLRILSLRPEVKQIQRDEVTEESLRDDVLLPVDFGPEISNKLIISVSADIIY